MTVRRRCYITWAAPVFHSNSERMTLSFIITGTKWWTHIKGRITKDRKKLQKAHAYLTSLFRGSIFLFFFLSLACFLLELKLCRSFKRITEGKKKLQAQKNGKKERDEPKWINISLSYSNGLSHTQLCTFTCHQSNGLQSHPFLRIFFPCNLPLNLHLFQMWSGWRAGGGGQASRPDFNPPLKSILLHSCKWRWWV